MILGMSTSLFTQLHVAISLLAIVSGFIVVCGMIRRASLPRMTAFFLITTALTSITGFFFPWKGVTPGIVIGVLSLLVLLLAAIARYGARLTGIWRGTWVISAALALYFNFFVLIVQLFEKVPALHALAPTQKEGPFKVAQLISLIVFVALTVWAVRRFRSGVLRPA
jgi:hypothetical protein